MEMQIDIQSERVKQEHYKGHCIVTYGDGKIFALPHRLGYDITYIQAEELILNQDDNIKTVEDAKQWIDINTEKVKIEKVEFLQEVIRGKFESLASITDAYNYQERKKKLKFIFTKYLKLIYKYYIENDKYDLDDYIEVYHEYMLALLYRECKDGTEDENGNMVNGIHCIEIYNYMFS